MGKQVHRKSQTSVALEHVGGTVGGPIVKNKLFFFFDYQAQRFDHPSTTLPISVFTSRERAGDFGDICTTGFAAGYLHDAQPTNCYDPLNGNAALPQ